MAAMDSLRREMPIGLDYVDLWYVLLDSIVTLGLEAEYRAFLPSDEACACDRFAFPEGRRQCLVSRVLVRTVLSSYTGVAPTAWEFHANRFGKPHVIRPAGCPLQFNLSNTTGLVVCAVSLGGEIGVDAEDLTRRAADPAIATNYFAPEEVAWLERASPGQRQLRFLQLWTLKEAFIKAKGKGLSIPLKNFAFDLPAGRPPQVEFRDSELGQADQWQFAQLRLEGRYQAAVAMHLPGGERRLLRIRRIIPLRNLGSSQVFDLFGEVSYP
jgi:4'-phosphopantetheinyl transferase